MRRDEKRAKFQMRSRTEKVMLGEKKGWRKVKLNGTRGDEGKERDGMGKTKDGDMK